MDHSFAVSVEWTGNRGTGTSDYRGFARDNVLSAAGKPPIEGSSAKIFHGDPARWNPEETLIAALVECHLLSYLYVAVRNGIVVETYTDSATGTLATDGDGAGRFTEVTLRPVVTISSGDAEVARAIHADANRLCFIAASVNFPVHHEPTIQVRPALSAESEGGA
ncbi:MAG TPA: OsmC family protein [Pseudolysinimonas sp.]|nr:OsmC family protein [Pseudolysinimonas sp.]